MVYIKKKRKYVNRNRNLTNNNKVINTIYIFLIIIMIIIMGIFIKLGLNERKRIDSLNTYEAKKEDNYEIVLKPNDFYLSETLPSGLYYASKSIDSINIDFKYMFKANSKLNLNYNYIVTADLIGKANTTDNQTKEVWNRRFNLTNNSENVINNTQEFLINQSVSIDYETYNNLVHLYEQTYGLKLDAVLKVRLNVNIQDSNVESKPIEDYIELEIPINNTITEVKENYENITFNTIIPSTNKVSVKEIIYYIIAILSCVGAIILIITIIRKNKISQNIYEKNINKILKHYGEIIATVEDEPNLANLAIMKVQNFYDLIDVAEQNKTNIIHYEVLEKQESYFYVVVDKYAYKYVVTENKLS